MNAWRYSGGTLAQGATVPPGNQTDPLDIFVQIVYGVGEQNETVVIDYQRNGFSVSVPAASLQVSILVPGVPFNVFAPPTLSGFMAPIPSSVRGGLTTAPTFTSPQFGGTATVQTPKRACAYRLLYASTLGAAAVSVLQQDSGLNQICLDTIDGTGGVTPLGPITRAAFIPLQRSAASVLVVNPAGPALQVQWLLDLG